MQIGRELDLSHDVIYVVFHKKCDVCCIFSRTIFWCYNKFAGSLVWLASNNLLETFRGNMKMWCSFIASRCAVEKNDRNTTTVLFMDVANNKKMVRMYICFAPFIILCHAHGLPNIFGPSYTWTCHLQRPNVLHRSD